MLLSSASPSNEGHEHEGETGKKNSAMDFLKKIGKVGGAANRDFRYAIGVDEGPSGKSAGNGLNVSRRELCLLTDSRNLQCHVLYHM